MEYIRYIGVAILFIILCIGVSGLIFEKTMIMSNPQIEWIQTYGAYSLDWGWSVYPTDDSGFIIGGESTSFGAGNYDAYIIKTDQYGNAIWDKTYGGTAKDGCRAIQQTQDGGYIIAGYSDSYGYPGHDFWLIRTDHNGNHLWDEIFGGPDSDAAVSVIQTSSGDFVLAGYSYSFSNGGKDLWVVKTNANGDEIWSQHYGGIFDEQGMSMVESLDGGYVIAGYTKSFGSGGTDIWLVKIDLDGNIVWDHCYGGLYDDWAASVDLTMDGGFIIAGDSKSYGNGGFDVWIIKTDTNGVEEWNQTYGSVNADETGYCVKTTSNNGYVISGTTNENIFDNALFLKFDLTGHIQWNTTISVNYSSMMYSICEPQTNSYVSTGYSYVNGPGNMDILLLKINDIDNDPPLANFTYIPKDPSTNDSIQFNDTSIDTDGMIVDWYWDFGDGNSSTVTNPSHRFDNNGIFSVMLTVTDNNNASDTMYHNVTVTNAPPIADFIYSPVHPTTQDIVFFTSLSNDRIIINYSWDFDDGFNSYEQNPSHQYNISGMFSVNLSVIDDDGDIASVIKTINVDRAMKKTNELSVGWNFISHPINKSQIKNDFIIWYNNSYYNWTMATTDNNPTNSSIVDSNMFGWMRDGQYYTLDSNLEPGYGYWIYAYKTCEIWTHNTSIPYEKYITAVKPGWNTVSVPYEESVNKTSVLVNNTSWSDAVTTGLIDNNVFGWDNAGQYYYLAETCIPGYAYWLYAYYPCILKRSN